MTASSHKIAEPAGATVTSVAALAVRARAASRALAKLSNEARNAGLIAAANAIEGASRQILEANAQDCKAAEADVAQGKMSAAMLARLRVGERGVAEMAARVRDVARLPDPLGQRLAATELDNGLVLYKESCPLGVVAIVFEARPEVVAQVGSLALKSGNALILKGGAEAANTNAALVSIWKECLESFSIPSDAICLLNTRADVMELLALKRDVDLIIPRGSRQLVEFIGENSRIPVLGHGEGICHVYVDRAADMNKALEITMDSKTQYPAVCNAAETLLVHEAIAREFLPKVFQRLKDAKVEVRGCPKTIAILHSSDVVPAAEEDWATEYSDLILSVKVVTNMDEAIDHIARYGSGHTESIVTEDAEAAKKFMNEVDAAGVFHNASTRFADGFRYGLGAELGVSTNKLHARGPMGLEGLTTYKYKLYGNGHTVAEYAKGLKKFTHRKI
jgi:glutamate-5-semialdehyde dehydrogenase